MLRKLPPTRLFSTKTMTAEFPPASVRAIVQEVAGLLKERKETVSVAETVCVILCILEGLDLSSYSQYSI